MTKDLQTLDDSANDPPPLRFCPREDSTRPTDVPPHERYVPPRPFSWRRSETPAFARFVWLLFLAGTTALLVVALRLTPDPRGHSTHERLGLAPCGFLLTTGYPCPTCGATTAFTWVVHGHPWMGLKTHPFGAVAAFACLVLLGMSLIGIVTAGAPTIRLSRRWSLGLALAIMLLILGSWLYKVIVMTAGR